MGFRDCNPGLNRVLNRDSYTGALADLDLGTGPFTGNRYSFAGGNPITASNSTWSRSSRRCFHPPPNGRPPAVTTTTSPPA